MVIVLGYLIHWLQNKRQVKNTNKNTQKLLLPLKFIFCHCSEIIYTTNEPEVFSVMITMPL
jgi:hypothetical protein